MSSGLDQLAALLPSIYKDLAQPSVQKIGKALVYITGFITTPLEKREALRDKNLKIFFEKLEKENEEDIVPVPPELGVPIMEKLRYVRSEELVDLYTELLLKSSLKKSTDKAHPSYLEIINCLSGDEARLLQYLFKNNLSIIPYIEIRFSKTGESAYNIINRYFTSLEDELILSYPDNLIAYLNNLIRLGIFEDKGNTALSDESAYIKLVNHPNFLKIKSKFEVGGTVNFHKSAFQITEFGSKFMEVCVPN